MIRQGQQLRMFMTPREIMTDYQPADGDRDDAYDPRQGSVTARSRNTMGQTNEPMGERTVQRHRQMRKVESEQFDIHRGPVPTTGYVRGYHEESDAQLWDRKLQESQMSPGEYHEHLHGEPKEFEGPDLGELEQFRSDYPKPRGSGSTAWASFEGREEAYIESRNASAEQRHMEWEHGPSIHQSIRESGVQFPVHLGTQFGSSGKPQVSGGHHRIAAAFDTRPDDYIPVLHNEGGIAEAKSEGSQDSASPFKYR